MKTLYLSGPMSKYADTDFNYPAFNRAAADLRRAGYVVFNPAEAFGGDVTLDKSHYLAVDYAAVSVCDAIAVLPGWTESSGARGEVACAESYGRKAYTIDELLDMANTKAADPTRRMIALTGYSRTGKSTV